MDENNKEIIGLATVETGMSSYCRVSYENNCRLGDYTYNTLSNINGGSNMSNKDNEIKGKVQLTIVVINENKLESKIVVGNEYLEYSEHNKTARISTGEYNNVMKLVIDDVVIWEYTPELRIIDNRKKLAKIQGKIAELNFKHSSFLITADELEYKKSKLNKKKEDVSIAYKEDIIWHKV